MKRVCTIALIVVLRAAEAHAATPDIAELGSIEALAADRPEVLMGFLVKASRAERDRSEALKAAVLRDFSLRLSASHANLWLGPQSARSTAFAFVDFSDPGSQRYLAQLGESARASGVRVVVFPTYLSEGGRDAAYSASSAVVDGTIVAALLPGVAGEGRPTIPAPWSPPAPPASMSSPAVVDQVEPAHLLVLAFGISHLPVVMQGGRVEFGVDPGSLIAFLSSSLKPPEASPASGPVGAPSRP